ncbi:MAG TPA: YlxR family protein [Candidatus Alectryocaccobium stercorigallinarum]|nr:YlxR family protein [Candidatus Alectryocaccobium stercorigallinarum]
MKKNPSGTTNKKVPMRTCCGCRQSFPKKELIRIVRTPDNTVEVDITGKKNGRGTYICRNTECLEKAVKSGAVSRSLEVQVSPEIYESLKTELSSDETR